MPTAQRGHGSIDVAAPPDLVYDLIAGFSYAYLGKKHGYEVPGAPSEEPTPLPSAATI